MTIFDGLAGTLNAVFGEAVTLTPPTGAPATVRGMLREALESEDDGSGRDHLVAVHTLRLPKPIPAAMVKGAHVTAPSRPGETFRILGVYPDLSPAADAFMVAPLEKIG